MKSLLSVSLFIFLFSTNAFARGYGMAGCGLGSILLGDKKGMMQIFAATSNGVGGQTFAMSSGTSNCVDGSGKTAKLFIQANKAALATDMARGEGETIISLATLLGCHDAGKMGQDLKANYKQVFPNANTSVETIYSSINIIAACKS